MTRVQRQALEPNSGASFKTASLVREGNQLVYRPTLLGRLFPRVFSWLGMAAGAAGLLQLTQGQLAGIAVAGAGLLFAWIGRYLLARMDSGTRFDTLSRHIDIAGQVPLRPGFDLAAERHSVSFDAVLELEMVGKIVDGQDSHYRNCELNLVMKDGRRFNLVSHPDERQIAAEADTLSRLLGVPVVDARQQISD